MIDRTGLAREALRAAMQLRRSLAIPREVPVNAFDVASMIGADVRFLDAPSLEGMLVRDPGLRVLLPSTKHRPKGRILFTCAHEVGHHELGHGTHVDEYLTANPTSRPMSQEEFLADSFAGHLLMPRPAVLGAFIRRQWNPERPTEAQLFTVAGELGVGYETLATHLSAVMEITPRHTTEQLRRKSVKSLKSELSGEEVATGLLVVDHHWSKAPIDLERGDMVIIPSDIEVRSPLLQLRGTSNTRTFFDAARAGTDYLALPNGRVILRVARQHYTGPLANRYLTDPDEH